jgi:sulfatase modifying factor 1
MIRTAILAVSLAVLAAGCGGPKASTQPEQPTANELDAADLPKVIVLDLGAGVYLELVRIDPGEFLMGSPADESERQKDELQHRVEITKPFYLGKYEVTQRQYTQLTGKANPSHFSSTGDGKERVTGLDTSCFPVEQVSWRDSVAFCEALNQKNLTVVPGIIRQSGYKFGLPTEAQWEYACRAETTTPFHFGNNVNGTQANCNGTVPYGTEAQGPFLQRTCKVGSYEANRWGLYDMHGNVLEWCADWEDDDYYTSSPTRDPEGPQTGKYRAYRGGGWCRTCTGSPRSAIRNGGTPGFRKNDLGFRVALVPAFRIER